MADIIVKDKNGNPITREGVTILRVPNTDGGKTAFEEMGNMVNEVAYYGVFPDGTSQQVTITGQWFASVGETYAMASLTDKQCQEIGKLTESGNYMLAIVFSKKTLEIGKTYNFSDL